MTATGEVFLISRHGLARLSQRGVQFQILSIVISHADVAIHAGDNCEIFRLSRNAAAALIAEQVVAPDEADQACRIAVLVGRKGVMSVLRPDHGPRGRRYRRQMETRAVSKAWG